MVSRHFPLIRGLFAVCVVALSLTGGPLPAQEGGASGGQPDATSTNETGPQPLESELATENDTASKRNAIPTTPGEMFETVGWWWFFAFVLLSVVALWFSIERLVVLRRSRVIPRAFVDRFLQHLKAGKLNRVAALKLCQQNGSPVAMVFAHGVQKWGKPSVEVEQSIIDGGERQVALLRKHLRVINGVATVSPLLGLLGTVIGMIAAFNQIAQEDAMGNPSELAAGIAIALITTAAGLMIAIPSLIMYMFLTGRVDTLVVDMDHLGQDLVHYISAEGLPQGGASHATAARKAAPTKKAAPKTAAAKE